MSEAVDVLEALLFASDAPIEAERIQEVLELDSPAAARELTDALRRRLDGEGRALQVLEVGGGFRLVTRPEVAPGYYVAPTLIADCKAGMKVVQEEIFGPVVVVVPFDDEDEGVALANGTDFGLYDYVFSADSARGVAALRPCNEMDATRIVSSQGGQILFQAGPFSFKAASLHRMPFQLK